MEPQNPFDGLDTPTQVAAAPVPGIGEALQPAPLQTGAPTTPQEFEQRKSAWQSIIDRVQTDPQMQSFLLHAGLRMLQPVAPGQTRVGHVAGAIAESLDANAQMQLKQREMARQEKATNASVEHTQAQTGQVRQAVEQSGELQPGRVQAQKLSLQEAQLQLKSAEIMQADLEAKKRAGLIGDSEYYTQQRDLAKRAAEAKITLDQAKAELDKKHGNAYQAAADVAQAKPTAVRQLMSKTEQPDGTIINHYLINGVPSHEMVSPPLNDKQATNEAEKQVAAEWRAAGKQLPGMWDKTVGNATAKEYEKAVIAKAATLRTPRVQWFDQAGKASTPPAIDTPPAGAEIGTGPAPQRPPTSRVGPANFPRVTAEEQKARNATQLGILQAELQRETDPAKQAQIRAEMQKVSGGDPFALPKGRGDPLPPASAVNAPAPAVPATPAASKVIKVVRDAQGKPTVAGQEQSQEPAVDTEDKTLYVRQQVRGGYRYSKGARGSGKTMAEWAAEDEKKRTGK